MSKAKNRYRAIEFAIILLAFGALVIVFHFALLPNLAIQYAIFANLQNILLYVGVGMCALALIVLFAAIAVLRKKAKKSQPESMPDAEISLDNNTNYNGSAVTYVPSSEAQTFMDMGSRQSVDEKFEQIAKMDKTQFVIYVARLFSRKGYQVKLTPVFDNFNIDMLVEKMGTTIAVGCILTDKILGESDVAPIAQGKQNYTATNVMALTNMYFDRTALDYAKANKMSLVDRVILAEDFMN